MNVFNHRTSNKVAINLKRYSLCIEYRYKQPDTRKLQHLKPDLLQINSTYCSDDMRY